MLILAYPWILLLIPLPVLFYFILKPYSKSHLAVKMPFFKRLTKLTGNYAGNTISTATRFSKQLLRLICWSALILALARPQYLENPIIRTTPTRDLMLAVDLSGSMDATDFINTDGQNISRLDAVKAVLGDFLTRRQGDRVGLIVFGNAAFVQVPFTQDLEACRILLNETAVRMAGPKTAIGDAIGLGITLFERSEVKQKVMIILTDGNDTGSKIKPVDAARIAADNNIKIYTIGIGDPVSVGEEKFDEKTLREIAKITDGQYFYANNREELEKVYTELEKLEVKEIESESYRPKRDIFYWPLAIMFILSLATQLRLKRDTGREQELNSEVPK